MKTFGKHTVFLFTAIILLVVFSNLFFFRIDLTSDKRHSVSKPAKKLMQNIKEPIQATVYLSGDLNPGFLRLKNSAMDLLEELSAYSRSDINILFVNPSDARTDTEREQNYLALEEREIIGTAVYEKDKEGKSIRKVVYPWIELSYGGKTIPVNLLKNDRTLSGEENLNTSIEHLEFELTDAIRRLTKTGVDKIAFLEGHGELGELETYDISKSLSRYFQIDRGEIGNDASILNDYKTVIIAKPTEPFSEKEKFVLDQYLMQGGTLLWLIDGVRLSEEQLATKGATPVIANDLNLHDMLFRYGIRINPVLIEDAQSTLMPVNIAREDESPTFEPMPWVFSPLLLTSSAHVATRNLPPIKASFASMTEPVGDESTIAKTVILATSSNTHIRQTPDHISLVFQPDLKDKDYFNYSFVPVGVALEGTFQSVFANRMLPPDVHLETPILKSSQNTRQIVIADGDIIRNEIQSVGDSIEALPLGFDRYMNQQFGNKELLVNSVLYLTDTEGWMELRSKAIPLRLLNKSKTTEQRTQWQIINLVIPLIFLLIFGVIYRILRKSKYTREA